MNSGPFSSGRRCVMMKEGSISPGTQEGCQKASLIPMSRAQGGHNGTWMLLTALDQAEEGRPVFPAIVLAAWKTIAFSMRPPFNTPSICPVGLNICLESQLSSFGAVLQWLTTLKRFVNPT